MVKSKKAVLTLPQKEERSGSVLKKNLLRRGTPKLLLRYGRSKNVTNRSFFLHDEGVLYVHMYCFDVSRDILSFFTSTRGLL